MTLHAYLAMLVVLLVVGLTAQLISNSLFDRDHWDAADFFAMIEGACYGFAIASPFVAWAVTIASRR